MNQFQSIINNLKSLKSVKADESLRKRISLLASQLPENRKYFYNPFFALKPLLIALLLLILTGTGIAVASQNAKQGDLLYPVKTIVNSLFSKPAQEPENLPAPTITPSPTNAIKGTIPVKGLSPKIETQSKKIILELKTTVLPTQMKLDPIKITPSPTPAQSLLPLDVNVNVGGIKINL